MLPARCTAAKRQSVTTSRVFTANRLSLAIHHPLSAASNSSAVLDWVDLGPPIQELSAALVTDSKDSVADHFTELDLFTELADILVTELEVTQVWAVQVSVEVFRRVFMASRVDSTVSTASKALTGNTASTTNRVCTARVLSILTATAANSGLIVHPRIRHLLPMKPEILQSMNDNNLLLIEPRITCF
ncbi:hypothetical protein GHT06_012290 [Daphnia sinensis]|uniref:Uncharacterized protein n=1 Tax=Daphnia sinensis TaxID=1820382 RepID=A0AAD5KVE8_9CRUS|nr:hypothetical protein GHT06_012290 [Daphnia sinensis]